MARSELRNFAQRLDTPSCVVICGVLVTVADELTLPTSTTNSLSSSSRTRTKGSLGYFWDHVYLKAKYPKGQKPAFLESLYQVLALAV